jgi:5-methylcytosine-specific restriction endonuclease McrA
VLNTKPIGVAQRKRILERDGFRCQMCTRSSPDLKFMHIDHKLPRSKGGTNDDDNLQVLCRTCNLKKQASEDWTPQNKRPSKYPAKKLQSQVYKRKANGEIERR